MEPLETVKISYSASLILNKVLVKILYTDSNPEHPAERDLPFNIKYKLQRAKSQIEPDLIDFNDKRDTIIKKYGVENPDTHMYSIPEDKKDDAIRELMILGETQTDHAFIKLKPEDVENIDVEGVSAEEITVFMVALIDDPAFKAELERIKVEASDKPSDVAVPCKPESAESDCCDGETCPYCSSYNEDTPTYDEEPNRCRTHCAPHDNATT